VVAGLLLCAMAANMVTVVARKSITIDEIVMIPSAYYHLAKGNFDLVRDHPPLSKIIAALPLLGLNIRTIKPAEAGAPLHSAGYIWAHYERFWEDNRARFRQISFWARIPPILLTIGLGVLIFAFTRELFNARAGVLAVALFSLEPTVLAHGRVVQTDIPAAFGYLLLLFALYRYLGCPAWARAAAVGAGGGVACLAKFSMLLVVPILVVTFAIMIYLAPRYGWRRERIWAHAGLAAVVALLVINASYGFHSRHLLPSDEQWIAESFLGHSAIVKPAVLVLSYILPTDFLLGVIWQIWHNQVGHNGYLLGEYSATGWWYYFPIAFALKTPLPFLAASIMAIGWCAFRGFVQRDRTCLFLLAALAIYVGVSLVARINIGVRYFLPAYALLFVMAGAALDRFIRFRRARPAGMAFAAGVLAWMVFEAARAYPNHIPYMNQLASGRPHWQYLSDSNVEWGDDVRELANYLRARGETQVRSAVLGGFLVLRYYNIENVDLIHPEEAVNTKTRYVAIGASFLNGSTVPGRVHGRQLTEDERVHLFAAYKSRQPEAVIGGSIFVYREDD
jgi:dolichyl-phosphate-mannose-protein mannosyltransferase